MVVIWKYKSKLQDLKKEVIFYTSFLARLLKVYRADNYRFKNDVTPTYDWVYSESKYQHEFTEHLDKFLFQKVRPAVVRLESARSRCQSIAFRLHRDLVLYIPGLHPVHKKTLNPETGPLTLHYILVRCLNLAQSAGQVITQHSKISRGIDGEIEKMRNMFTEYKRAFMADPEHDLGRVNYNQQWKGILQFERTSLKNMNFCVYSCAFRPPKSRWCGTLRAPMTMAKTDPQHVYNWTMLKEFRCFYYAVFKHRYHCRSPKKLVNRQVTLWKIDSFFLSAAVIKATFSFIVPQDWKKTSNRVVEICQVSIEIPQIFGPVNAIHTQLFHHKPKRILGERKIYEL